MVFEIEKKKCSAHNEEILSKENHRCSSLHFAYLEEDHCPAIKCTTSPTGL